MKLPIMKIIHTKIMIKRNNAIGMQMWLFFCCFYSLIRGKSIKQNLLKWCFFNRRFSVGELPTETAVTCGMPEGNKNNIPLNYMSLTTIYYHKYMSTAFA